MTKELEAYEKMSENQRNKYVEALVKKQLTKQFNSFTSYGILKAYKAIYWFLEFSDEIEGRHIYAERYTLKYIIGAPIIHSLAIDDYKSYREGFVLNRHNILDLGQEKIDDKYNLVNCFATRPDIEIITKITVDKSLYEKIKAKKELLKTYIEDEKCGRNYVITDVKFENNDKRVITYIVVPSVHTAILEMSEFREYELTEHLRYEILGDNGKSIEAENIKTQELVADIVKRISDILNYNKIAMALVKHFKLKIKNKNDNTNDIIIESLEQILKSMEEKLIKIMYGSDEAIKANKGLFEAFESAKMSYRRFIVTSYHKISSEEKAFHFLKIYTDSALHAKYVECELEVRGKI